MSNYRFIQEVEDMRVFNDGDSTMMEPRDVLGKVEYANGEEKDYGDFSRVDYHDDGRENMRMAEAADYNG